MMNASVWWLELFAFKQLEVCNKWRGYNPEFQEINIISPLYEPTYYHTNRPNKPVLFLVWITLHHGGLWTRSAKYHATMLAWNTTLVQAANMSAARRRAIAPLHFSKKAIKIVVQYPLALGHYIYLRSFIFLPSRPSPENFCEGIIIEKNCSFIRTAYFTWFFH